MIPQSGQQIKCIFRNGATAEGIVDEWSEHTAKLRSLDGQSILIIMRPTEDIMLIKVLLSDNLKINAPLPTISQELEMQIDSQDEEESIPINPFNPDYNKKLVELRKELANQEKRIIVEKLREHRPSIGATKVKYEYPGSGKKSSSE